MGMMRNVLLFTFVTAVALGGFAAAWTQQKPVSSRTSIIVYKSPT
jgi:hypothetical protein